MAFLINLAWRDLRAGGSSLKVFVACVVLGVMLISACAGLYRLIGAGLLADTRQLLGGDVEVDSNTPLPPDVLKWLNENGKVALVTELYTMLSLPNDEFLRVELQAVDQNYPLYGQLTLAPQAEIAELTAFEGGRWGALVDASLAQRHDLAVGDIVGVGAIQLEIRALVLDQPDRNLSADWRGQPVLIAEQAMQVSQLIQPYSRVDYEYHVATDQNAADWRNRLFAAFPRPDWEVRTFEDRSERISERLGQIASGLLIIGFSTLFIGGLGVFSSVQSHLRGKLKTIATLRSLGLRNSRLATVYLMQVVMLGGAASLIGALLGAFLALAASGFVAEQLKIDTAALTLIPALLSAIAFGMLVAVSFALPAVGKALSVSPATLFRDLASDTGSASIPWWLATAMGAAITVILLLWTLPDIRFGLGFVLVVGLLLLLLELVMRLLRQAAKRLAKRRLAVGGFALRLALGNLRRVDTPLRSALLSLGSALTLVVACTLVVVTLLRSIHATIPAEAPALVLYDMQKNELPLITEALKKADADARWEHAPLVRARMAIINDVSVETLIPQADERRRDALVDDHKLSYRGGNVDGIKLIEGQWWTEPVSAADGEALPMSLEDREANRLGLGIGDEISYRMNDVEQRFVVHAIHQQKGLQTRFWFESIVADGSLESHIQRYVGAAYLADEATIDAQRRIAEVAPVTITVRTARLLKTAQALLGQATMGLSVIAGLSLIASVLVLIAVIAAGRSRQLYDATLLTTLGARLDVIRRSQYLEYLLLALVTATFAVLLGAAIALPLLEWRMKLPAVDLIWVGAFAAVVVSVTTLGLGAHYFLRRLKLSPALLLRSAR